MNLDELVQLRELVPDHNREVMACHAIILPPPHSGPQRRTRRTVLDSSAWLGATEGLGASRRRGYVPQATRGTALGIWLFVSESFTARYRLGPRSRGTLKLFPTRLVI